MDDPPHSLSDAASARLCEALGFSALATTSSERALRLGKLDYEINLAQSLEIAAELAGATDVPVSVDFEDGFAVAAEAVADNVIGALDGAKETMLSGDFLNEESLDIDELGDQYEAWSSPVSEDIGFYVDLALRSDGPVLELAVGNG